MDSIEYPKKHSEAEVQAQLYLALQVRRIDARLQVVGRMGAGHHILDVVVFSQNLPQVIIECKSYRRLYKSERLLKTRQLRKYRCWGLPVLVCCQMDEIPETVDRVQRILAASWFEPAIQDGGS